MERIAEYVSKMNIPKLKDLKIYFMGCRNCLLWYTGKQTLETAGRSLVILKQLYYFFKNNNVSETVFTNTFEGIYPPPEALYFILYIHKSIKFFVKKKQLIEITI